MTYQGVELDDSNIPHHIAIIMDGNGRWGLSKGKTRMYGHRKGMETLVTISEGCGDLGVKVLTVFAFSTENWSRPQKEVNGLMGLIKIFYKKEINRLQKNNIKVLHTGLRDRIPKDVLAVLDKAVVETSKNTGPILNLAINYSGKIEILSAIQKILQDYQKSEKSLNLITEEEFKSYLFHPELPDPDLVIRTSGEMRISNFLLWQMAYSELYFIKTHWPDFTKKDLALAISSYQKRERRFGSHG